MNTMQIIISLTVIGLLLVVYNYLYEAKKFYQKHLQLAKEEQAAEWLSKKRLYHLTSIADVYGYRIIQSTMGIGLYQLEQFGIVQDGLNIADLDEFFAYHEMLLKEGSDNSNLEDVFVKSIKVKAELKKIK